MKMVLFIKNGKNMKYKVIHEIADKESGWSVVTIQTKEGNFSGASICNSEDEFSTFVGIRYAERRAVAAWAKHKAKIAKIQLRTMQTLKKDLEIKYSGVFRFPKNKELRAIKIKIRDYSNDIKYWTEAAKSLEESIQTDDQKRADILSRYASAE